MSLLPGSSMSLQEGFQNLKDRFLRGKSSKKRIKLGEDEDDWCDALNHLSVESDEEYFDASEQQIDSKSLHTGTKRKKAQGQKPSEQKIEKKSKMYRPTLRPHKPSTSVVQSRKTNEGIIEQRQRQRSQGHSNGSRQISQRTDLSASSTSAPQKAYQVGDGGSNTAFSSSSGADAQAGLKRLPHIDEQPPRQLPMTGYEDKGGIPESKLEKLAKALLSEEYRNVRLLGQKLGFTLTELYGYCPYIKPNDSSGIFRMLRAWKSKTSDAKQMPCLLEALKKADLKHLADDVHSQEGKFEKRKVKITLMTSWHLNTIEGLKKKLTNLQRARPDLIEAVKVLELPFSGLQRYTFTEDVDIMVLCHSIVNRRFSITNVTDSLYDEFLDYCNKKLGKERIAVIAHDFTQEKDEVRAVSMNTFKHTQWSTFEKAGLVMICGMMDKTPDIQENDWNSLVKFLEDASKSSPANANRNQRMHLEKGTSDTKREPIESNKISTSLATSSSRTGGMKTRSRKPVIYICTSLGLYSIIGLKENLKTLSETLFSKYEIKEQDLPYSSLEDFKFPPEVDRTDAMILCHSVQNRGFSITDVDNSIYDEFLKYCNRVFGKNHMAVIVHDFECKPEILKIHIETFQRTQPTTYELADCVALAGQLNVPDVKLCHDKSTSLDTFVRRLR